MPFDRPPRITERRTSSGRFVSRSPQIIARMISLSLDKTPTKPLRIGRWIPEAKDCTHTYETESSSDVFQISSEDDEKSVDHVSEHSDILDSSSFIKSEALEPLHEEQDKSPSFEIAGRRKFLRSSSSDRAIFEIEGHDTPPQLATRLHSPWREDSKPTVNDRFGNNVPREKDTKTLSFEITGRRRKLLRLSSCDRAVFQIEGHDTPPQLATRLHSPWREDSKPTVNGRFGNNVPREKDTKTLSFEISDRRRKLLRSSSCDRAVFQIEGHDTPPQLATRLHSPWREDSKPIVNGRFENNVLREKDTKTLSFEITDRRRKPLRSSSCDRAVFQIEGHDTPLQLAARLHSSFDWREDSEPIVNGKFRKNVPREKDNKPKPLPRLSDSKQVTIPPPSALPKLAEAFRSGCITGTHTYHLKKYPNTFVGSEAVDFMLSAKLASTREDAVFLGQRFCNELNLFHHVCWDHTFKDGNYFYRYNDESATQLSKEDLVRLTEKFVEGIMKLSKCMRRRRFKTYQNTFLGEEAVNYMLQENLVSTRPDAVFLGQRMMEELNIFEPVAHNSRFKDSCYLYRLTTDNKKSLCFDESAEIMSLMESIDSQHHRYTQLSPLAPITGRRAKRSVLSSRTICGPRKKSKVSFGLVKARCFERSLDCNPATASGPSLGLGWRFYDDLPVPLGGENPGVLELRGRGGLVSVKDRTAILKEWGYSKMDIKKATRLNKTIRKQRKRSLNKYQRV